jgi:hypothetical protein
VIYVPPSRGDELFDADQQPRDVELEPSPAPPPAVRPRPPRDVLGENVEQLRPPKSSGQKNTQVRGQRSPLTESALLLLRRVLYT